MTLIADNPFICKKELVPFEKGIRIDYILFKVGVSLVSHTLFFFLFVSLFLFFYTSMFTMWLKEYFPFFIARVLPKWTFVVISCPPPRALSLTIHSHTPTMKL